MIRVIDRFWYRFTLWCRERREEYFSGMRFFWKRLAVTIVLLALGFGIGIAMGAYYTEPRHLLVVPQEAQHESLDSGYALFTWARSGKLCFAFMPKCKSGQFARSWFAKCTGDCGISRLEDELSAFPEGTSIEWDNWPDGWGGWRFGWPQDEVTDRIKKFAKEKHLNLTFCCSWLDAP